MQNKIGVFFQRLIVFVYVYQINFIRRTVVFTVTVSGSETMDPYPFSIFRL
jgi:hypothetical protein